MTERGETLARLLFVIGSTLQVRAGQRVVARVQRLRSEYFPKPHRLRVRAGMKGRPSSISGEIFVHRHSASSVEQ